MEIENDISLANFTTIGLGGKAKFFARCETVEDIKQALAFAKEKNISVHVLGGGSNTIFDDKGFAGLVLHVALSGIIFQDEGEHTLVTVGAGEVWDSVVAQTIERGLAGIECLSGIPGSTGAAPIQNIGAYGQEVAEVLQLVHVLDQHTLKEKDMALGECTFAYRTSVFKQQKKSAYIVLGVTLALRRDGVPTVKYEQLQQELPQDVGSGKDALRQVREAVLRLRRKKSMVLDSNDPNTKSCGSFFINPIVSGAKLAELESHTGDTVPHFEANGGKVKLSAAWLIEQAGFTKGYRKGGVGLSTKHSLALVNFGGTTDELLELAHDIQEQVQAKFGVELVREPVAIPYEYPVQ